MKKTAILIFLFATSTLFFTNVSAQNNKPYPIPSYNILVSGPTIFQESSPSNMKEKRNIQVKVFCQNKSDTTCCATVVIYSLDLQNYLGPFRVCCGETLVQEIDEREWGVATTAPCPVTVSVWTTGKKEAE